MQDDHYMQRCLGLAKLGAGAVAPNPMVGAVLVHDDIIIGEGWHQQYGGPHAEVNCIGQAVQNDQNGKLDRSILYVSLEPCAHHGKTPPCADLIIQHKIPKVVIGCRDPFKEVDGRGIEKLKAAGVEVKVGVMERECKELNKRFLAFHTLHRPYVVLKWAQTKDGMIALPPPEGGISDPDSTKNYFEFEDSNTLPAGGLGKASRLMISNECSNRLVHKWRSEEASILIGTNTALQDDPELTTRFWPGPSPVRLVVDMDLKLPATLKIFSDASPTIIFNTKVHTVGSESPTPSQFIERIASPSASPGRPKGMMYYKVKREISLVQQVISALYKLNIQSVLVEGGAKLLQSFIDEGIWDEVRTITSSALRVTGGLHAPVFPNAIKIEEEILSADKIEIYRPKDSD